MHQYIEDLNMVDGKRKALMFKQGLIGANDGAGGWQDEPVLLSHAHGTNSYDRTTKMISVVIRGDRPLKIVQMPVVSVGMSLAVSETEVCVCVSPPRSLLFSRQRCCTQLCLLC